MSTQIAIFGFWSILHFFFLFFSFTFRFENLNYFDDSQSVVFDYNRVPEVKKQCSPFLSSGSKAEGLIDDDIQIERLKRELSFQNGDWEQENNGIVPLIFIIAKDSPSENISPYPLQLVNFEVRDVKPLDEAQSAVGIGAVMSIGMTMSESFSSDLSTKFTMDPGLSVLTIVFEGVYTETQGERLLCLLGNTTLPALRWLKDWQNEFWGPNTRCPNPIQDDQILLTIRYPKVYNLTSRSIRGEMRSLRTRSSFVFFDMVLISSQLGYHSEYQFSSAKELDGCNPDAHQEELTEDGANKLSGSDFCRIFQGLSTEVFSILPDYHKTSSSKTDTWKLGPFVLGKEILFVDESYNSVKLIVQNVKCEVTDSDSKTSNAKLAAVFRVIPSPSDHWTSTSRTGFSSMTLPAEGTWDSSTGQLCMVGSVPNGEKAQISLFFSRVFSVKQRSIVFGSISSTPDSDNPFVPLHFNVIQSAMQLDRRYGWYIGSYLSYNYSKTDRADEFRRRSQTPDTIRVSEKESPLKYPAIRQEADGLFSLSEIHDLTYDLLIDSSLSTTTTVINGVPQSVMLEVVSIGPFIARYDLLYKVRSGGILADVKSVLYNDNDHLLMVSLRLKFSSEEYLASTGLSYTSLTSLFLEGLYDFGTGVMYLIGCGKVHTGVGVEQGFDCLMEAKVQYPHINSPLLQDPTVKITITSQRNTSDPLYFNQIDFQTPYVKF